MDHDAEVEHPPPSSRVIIGDGELCDLCKKNNTVYRSGRKDVEKFNWGTLEEIYERRSCPFCSAILRVLPVELVRRYAEKNLPAIAPTGSPDKCLLTWKSDEGRWSVAYENSRTSGLLGSILISREILSGLFRGSRRETCYLFDNKCIDYSFIQGCLEKCKKQHGRQEHANPGSLIADFLVIDVVDQCIVHVDQRKVDYVTLSYVWGGIEVLKSTERSREYLGKKGALDELQSQVPWIVQDAMWFTQSLSQRYL